MSSDTRNHYLLLAIRSGVVALRGYYPTEQKAADAAQAYVAEGWWTHLLPVPELSLRVSRLEGLIYPSEPKKGG